MDTNEKDVVIVGAGPAGAALAIQLSELNLKVLLVDRESFPRDKVCGDYVRAKGVARLLELGIEKEIVAINSQPITASRIYLNKTLLTNGGNASAEGDAGHGLVLPRSKLDHALVSHAASRGVQICEKFSANAVTADANGPILRGEINGSPIQVRARVIVGADGANSEIAKSVGLQCKDPRYITDSLRAYVHGLSLSEPLIFFDERFFPGYGWVFPIQDGFCNFGVGIVRESILRDNLNLQDFYNQFKLLVHRLAESRNEQIEIEPPKEHQINGYGGAVKNYFDGGLLVGEAGRFVDPLNGQGISFALDSAKCAAREIKRCFEVGDFSLQSIAQYETSWRRHFEPDLGVSDLIVALLRNKDFRPLWLSLLKANCNDSMGNKKYADIAGGVISGVIPARKALTPEMFIQPLTNPMAFWREVVGGESTLDFSAMMKRSKQLLATQSDFSRSVLGKDNWTREWLKEIATKQASVLYNQATVNHHG